VWTSGAGGGCKMTAAALARAAGSSTSKTIATL
jgi:hypothetical protein